MDVELRYRGKPLRKVVEDLDAFPKVAENVQEEKRASGGFVAFVCLLLVLWMSFGEVRDYIHGHAEYKFLIDVNFNSSMLVDLDMVIAMPCGQMSADLSGAIQPEERKRQQDNPLMEFFPMQLFGGDQEEDDPTQLKLRSTRFEFTKEELKYWNILKEAQRLHEQPDFKSLSDLLYIRSNVLTNLRQAGEEKQREHGGDRRHGQDQDPMAQLFGQIHGGGAPMLVISGGGGGPSVVRFVHSNMMDSRGTACRVHGQIPVLKKAGTIQIAPGKKINIGPLQGRMNMHDQSTFNFSHRIEHMGFGPRLPGLVLPLTGTEEISHDYMNLYQYYLKIVPTRIQQSFGDPIVTYQYSVTKTKRAINHDAGSHGMPGINIRYELTPIMIEIRAPADQTFLRLLVRLCAIAGGLFATSMVLYALGRTLVDSATKTNTTEMLTKKEAAFDT